MLHLGSNLAFLPVRRIKRGTEGASRVVRSRLDEYVVEHLLQQQAASHGAVQGNATRHGKSAMTRHGLIVPEQVSHDLLESFLQAGGEVHVLFLDGFVPAARWIVIEHDVVVPRLPDDESPLWQQLVEAAKELPIDGRVAVRGQAHHLVFFELPVADETDQPFVEYAQRVWNRQLLQDFPAVLSHIDYKSGLPISPSVDSQHQAIGPTRQPVGRGGMRPMVVDELERTD